MSLRWRDRRAQLFGTAGGGTPELRRDFRAPRAKVRRRTAWVPLAIVTVVALLGLASLRLSILRMRYALAATLQHETELRSREREAAVAARLARDPRKLGELASRLGFARPERVIDLADGAERP